MEIEKYPRDDLKNDKITAKREKREMNTDVKYGEEN
ncbi:hypothetical protein T4D_9150 [Trichinella pseudospiralis]|uniref:Uncharacterized protein n=1 Tax=Trichinella pseudospiralis TaxID=6337 RepID=A0A0V1DMC4_TRIPS|nr:hypothetical protein T4D_9150 [Trichinella pseudospiralis]